MSLARCRTLPKIDGPGSAMKISFFVLLFSILKLDPSDGADEEVKDFHNNLINKYAYFNLEMERSKSELCAVRKSNELVLPLVSKYFVAHLKSFNNKRCLRS